LRTRRALSLCHLSLKGWNRFRPGFGAASITLFQFVS